MRVESSFLAGTLRDAESEKLRASYAATLAALQDTLGNGAPRRGLADVAFGSLLHVVQDSFAFGHAERAKPVTGAVCPGTSLPQPGATRAFRSYSNQD